MLAPGWATDSEAGKLSSRIINLIRKGTIALAPCGFSDANHDYLSLDERNQNLQWAVSNPWKTGIADLGLQKPYILLPFAGAENTSLLGNDCMVLENGGEGRLLVRSHFDGLPRQADVTVMAPGSRLAKSDTHFRFILIGIASLRDVEPAIRSLLSIPQISVTNLIPWDELTSFGGHVESTDLIIRSRTPAQLESLYRMAELRQSRVRDHERMRELLLTAEALAMPAQSVPQHTHSKTTRTLLASMQGDVNMHGHELDARFRSGQLVSLSGKKIITRSWITVNGTETALETLSAVSLESQGSRGLRQTMVLKKNATSSGFQAECDYLFVDNCPWLVLEMDVHFHQFKPALVTEFCPLALSFPVQGKLSIENRSNGTWQKHDLSNLSTRISPASAVRLRMNSPWQCFPGNAWTIRWNNTSLHIRRTDQDTSAVVPFDIRLYRTIAGLFLECVPEAALHNCNESDLAERALHFACAISYGSQDEVKNELPAAMVQQTGKSWTGQKSGNLP